MAKEIDLNEVKGIAELVYRPDNNTYWLKSGDIQFGQITEAEARKQYPNAFRKQKKESTAVMSMRTSAKLKKDAVKKFGTKLPAMFNTWLTGITYPNKLKKQHNAKTIA